MTSYRSVLAVVSVIVFSIAITASASAAQIFGSQFTNEPANSGECAALAQPCTIVSFIHPQPGTGNRDSAGAPVSGVVTKVRFQAKVGESPTQVTFMVAAQAAQSTTATASITAVGPTVTLEPTEAIEEDTGKTPIREFDTRMPIQVGQQLAVQGTDFRATHNASGDRFSFVYAPPLAAGQPARPSTDATGELLIQGTIEPDADGDGFGDETQDGCPSQSATQGACVTAVPAGPNNPPPPAADKQAPKVSGLRVANGRIQYKLSESATTRFLLEKKVGRKFKHQGRQFFGPEKAGSDRRALPGAKTLAKGAYRLKLTVIDASGNKATYSARFQI
jgi:hypothetical protein